MNYMILTVLPLLADSLHVGNTRSLVERAVRSPKIVYGVMTCNQAEKQRLLQAQLDTWAHKVAAQGRFFALTGKGKRLTGNESQRHTVRVNCSDELASVACKEAHIMKTGYDWEADWLVVLGEDNYVDTAQLEDFLVSNVSNAMTQPTIFGIVGCGGACAAPGLCGGGGYIVSRAALQRVFATKAKVQQVMMEYQGFLAGDVATACIFHTRGVKFTNLADYMYGANFRTEGAWKSAIETHPMTLHYLTPAVMHWVHEQHVKHGWAEEVPHSRLNRHKKLAADAFDKDGCCCYPDEKSRLDCVMEMSKPLQSLFTSRPLDLQLRYIRERTMRLSMQLAMHSKAGPQASATPFASSHRSFKQ